MMGPSDTLTLGTLAHFSHFRHFSLVLNMKQLTEHKTQPLSVAEKLSRTGHEPGVYLNDWPPILKIQVMPI
jgi:hypothetical protein